MIHDQADELRQLVERGSAVDRPRDAAVPLIVVGGGKSTVGTTTVATNLAVALARRGRRTLFVDADAARGGRPVLGCQGQGGCLTDVLLRGRPIDEVLERGTSDVLVLSGAAPDDGLADLPESFHEQFIGDLKNLSRHAEIVVIDAGNYRDLLARQLWKSANATIAVTTCEPAAIVECYATIKVHLGSKTSARIYTLVNRAGTALAARDIQARLAETCQRFLGFEARSAGHIGTCEPTTRDEQLEVFSAQSAPARALDRLAASLSESTTRSHQSLPTVAARAA